MYLLLHCLERGGEDLELLLQLGLELALPHSLQVQVLEELAHLLRRVKHEPQVLTSVGAAETDIIILVYILFTVKRLLDSMQGISRGINGSLNFFLNISIMCC